jgi:sortase A
MRGRSWRIAESIFLIAGLGLLDWYIWIRAGSVLNQANASRVFRSEQRQGLPATSQRPRPDEVLGSLRVPRLGIDAMVREGDDEATLADSVGHLPSSPLPGAPGNVALAGHRDTFFWPLRKIRVNDLVTFATLRGTFEYQVESLRIVLPDDVSVLQAAAEPTLTLVTCYPFSWVGSAPKRFIVQARQIDPAAPVPAPQGVPVARSRHPRQWPRLPGLSASAARRRHRRS